MNEPYQLKYLFPFIDYSLVPSQTQDVFPNVLDLTMDTSELQKKLAKAHILFIHPDGVLQWSSILLEIHTKEPLSIDLILLAGSDLTLGHEHLDPFLEAFPTTRFWIQNWFGFHERICFLPIGVNGPCSQKRTKQKSLGISFFLNYPGYIHREEFSEFLQTTPEIQPYCLPRVPYETYCELVSECYFSCCPMGGGYDTFRFWETLLMGTIPIVKKHLFYDVLLLHYPKLPILLVNEWKDVLHLDLSKETYDTLMKEANVECLYLEYWKNQIHCGK